MKQLLKTSGLSGISTFTKIITGVLTLKIVALYTGPQGVAILGQFMSLVSILSVLAGGGISLGLIKYASEYKLSDNLGEFLSSAMFYTLFFSLITMVCGCVFSVPLSQWLFGSSEFEYLLKWTSVAQLFIAVSLLLSSLITGFGNVRLLVIINVLISIISLSLISVLSIFYQLKGTLIGFVLSQSIAALITVVFLYKEQWFCLLFTLKMKKSYLLKLFSYSIMTLVSTLTVPIAQIIVRNDISTLLGWDSVGYWQAVVRLSDAYLLFITTALTSYYLPRLSELQTTSELKREIGQAYRVLMPIIALILFALYIFRDIIIKLLYTESFGMANSLFLYQLIGDFFRTAGWLFTYLMLAKSWTKMYITTEIILSLLFISTSTFFVRTYGLIGVTYAFALTYFIYWLLMATTAAIFFKRESKKCLPAINL